MIGQFEIATRDTGVNGGHTFADKRVIFKDSELPEFDETSAWVELLRVCELVAAAKGGFGADEDVPALETLVKRGDVFFTKAMRAALGMTDMMSGAMAVRMDDPIDLWIALDRYCRDDLGLKPVLEFQPATGINFIRGAGNFWDMVAGPALVGGLDQAFAVKWKRMVARPQEVVVRAIQDPSKAPDLFLAAIEHAVDFAEVSQDPRTFTVYEEGCPSHPSYVAGHGTFAGVVYALLALKYGLHKKSAYDDEIAQTLLSFAHCRSIAGVHYFQDNALGVWLGIEYVRRDIGRLAGLLGMSDEDVAVINAAAENLKSDWVK